MIIRGSHPVRWSWGWHRSWRCSIFVFSSGSKNSYFCSYNAKLSYFVKSNNYSFRQSAYTLVMLPSNWLSSSSMHCALNLMFIVWIWLIAAQCSKIKFPLQNNVNIPPTYAMLCGSTDFILECDNYFTIHVFFLCAWSNTGTTKLTSTMSKYSPCSHNGTQATEQFLWYKNEKSLNHDQTAS